MQRSGWGTQTAALEWLDEAVTPRIWSPAAPGLWAEGEPPPASRSTSGLKDLLRLVRVSEGSFRRHEERYFSALERLLRAHGAMPTGPGLNRDNFIEPVRSFQETRGLNVDGLPGAETLWELQEPAGPTHAVVKVEADVVSEGGLPAFRLRSDVAPVYTAMRQDVVRAGAVVSSAGSLRDLDEPVSTGRSSTSLHYTGIALDLATNTGMQDVHQPYLVTAVGDRRWQVWARSDRGIERTLDAVLWSRGALRTERVTAGVVDFTGIAVRHGFLPIRHRKTFPANYMSAEWWHFQYEGLLTPFISLFGIELLRLYPKKQLQRQAGLWQRRQALWQSDWF